MIFALAGNQNCGKTTLFNQLTGSNQHVGNFPGITMEQKIGKIRTHKSCSVVDLPGIYSIRSYSAEEKVTRNYLINEKPDGILNIIDATNIERNLYLTLQLIELGTPMVLALNMMDEVRGNGGTIDIKTLSAELGIPVVPISAVKNEGINELIEQIIHVSKNRIHPKVTDFCKGAIHRCIHSLVHLIEDHAKTIDVSGRFAVTKLIEGDPYVTELLNLNQNEKELVEHDIAEMESECGMDRNAALADMRYSFIEGVCAKTVVKSKKNKEHERSLKIDALLTNKYLALPLFFTIMLTIFWLTFDVIGSFLSELLAGGVDFLTGIVDTALLNYGINPIVHSLVIDGIFTGVGSVLSFMPIIVTLFFFLSILEDSGYMARVAFIMDKLLRKIGLSGRSFVPMLIGFGCTVPAIMATRSLASDRDRKMTVLLTPFMSCTAKIPIYAVFTTAFFMERQALIMIALYIMGMTVGVICAALLNKTKFKGKPVPFVMELPNYRMPSLKSVLLLMWDKAKDFLLRAFTVIFIATIIIWFLQSFDAQLNTVQDSADSLLAIIGKFISPVFAPLGFNNWRISTALITGITAKEAVISTLSVLTGSDADNLTTTLSTLFTTQSAFSFLTFTLLYTPCIAAISAMKRELDSGFKTVLAVISQCAIAWIVAFLVTQPTILLIIIILLCVLMAISNITGKMKNNKCGGCSGNCGKCK